MVVGDVPTGVDVAVIGGGPGGYTAAIRAAQRDLDVALVADADLGGTCLNHGCIPSKALISATRRADRATDETAAAMGIDADVSVDAGAMVDWKDGVVDGMTSAIGKLCKANQVEVVEGHGVLTDASTLRVEGEHGSESLDVGHVVVATGSRPVALDGFDDGDGSVLNSRQALALDHAPERLVIVGAGYVGMEMATVFTRMGSDVTVLEALDGAMPGYADDLTRPVVERARETGVDFVFEAAVEGWTEADDGEGAAIEVATEDGSHACDRVLVAVGREPVTDTCGLADVGVDLDEETGAVVTDETMQTSVDGIYAVGDAAGEPMLAHVAGAEARVAAGAIAGEPSAMDNRAVPAAVFTDPEIATVGLTEDEAADEGFEVAAGEFPLRASGRAAALGESEGFVRLVADADRGFVLGGQAVGPEASEVINELALAVEMGATLEDLAGTIHVHPTLGEAVMEAAENALGEAIHTLNR